MIKIINFYRTRDEYGFLSNFYKASINIDGNIYKTTEHYFQSQKFDDKIYAEKVKNAADAGESARLGRSRDFPLKGNWESIKEDVMLTALRAKFNQHSGLRQQLIATGDAQLVEHTVNDSYWGDGGDGSGKNRLGILLMQIREELK